MGTTKQEITIETIVKLAVAKVWDYWTKPGHIVKWNHASDDWHTTYAENDLSEGGKFSSRMEAKDGSFGFDFGGIYDVIREHEYIEYTFGDGRKVKITFTGNGIETKIVETFEAESSNSIEMQRSGWQSILDNFKKYTETINWCYRINQ
ncbi:MAG TPA: SRPBCC family protein [Hanamia sp.]|nr:SRPBCC family protein [Hanamia sp.]